MTDGQKEPPRQECGIVNSFIPLFLAAGAVTGWSMARSYGIGLGIVGSVVGAVLGIPALGLVLAAIAGITAGIDRLTNARPRPPLTLFGPWRTPSRTRAGDRLFCQLRGWVVVGGLSDSPVPWPYMKARGRHSPILTGDLVRAVRKEAAIPARAIYEPST